MSMTLSIRHGVGGLAHVLLPRHIKRLMLYSSLTAIIRHQPELDRDTLEKLNDVMHLSSDVDAMKFPVFIKRAIWKGEQPIQIHPDMFVGSPTATNVDALAQQLIDKIPRWLRYDHESTLHDEVTHYLRHCRDYLDRRFAVRDTLS